MLRICPRCAIKSRTPIILHRKAYIRFYSIDSRESTEHNDNIGHINPPRILFFGSDSFSTASLHKLQHTKFEEPNLYESLQIITREPAPSGRGLKLEKRPVQIWAENNDIPFQTVTKDSITKIDPTDLNADLLIAVSFGLFVPPKLIRAVDSTINVHPSLLPRYRGPAPIHHAIANGDQQTGVSLQTLSPDGFDQGVIFDQSLPIDIEEDELFTSLWDRLAILGADLLVSSIRNRTYLNPQPIQTSTYPSYAGPIHKHIDWNITYADKVLRLGRLHDPVTGAITLREGRRIDILLNGIHPREQHSKRPPGSYAVARDKQTGETKMFVVCADGKTVWIDQVKVSGKKWISGVQFVASASDRFWSTKFVPWRKEFEDHDPKEFEY